MVRVTARVRITCIYTLNFTTLIYYDYCFSLSYYDLLYFIINIYFETMLLLFFIFYFFYFIDFIVYCCCYVAVEESSLIIGLLSTITITCNKNN